MTKPTRPIDSIYNRIFRLRMLYQSCKNVVPTSQTLEQHPDNFGLDLRRDIQTGYALRMLPQRSDNIELAPGSEHVSS